MITSIFLTAEWRYLVMLNYAVQPEVLQPLVPHGTELDFYQGRTFLSVVGFRFVRVRVCGVAIPLHTDFEEVNLRFYVRRRTEEGWRRGVVFVRELVPRRAIAFVARTFYGEPYSALPMRHRIEHSATGLRAEYCWRRSRRWESLSAAAAGPPRSIELGSEEEFITEHYWGYTASKAGCNEYQVEHRRWRVWTAHEAALDADIGALYGSRFVCSLSGEPTSAFIAEGSPVTVRAKSVLRAGNDPRDRLVGAGDEPLDDDAAPEETEKPRFLLPTGCKDLIDELRARQGREQSLPPDQDLFGQLPTSVSIQNPLANQKQKSGRFPAKIAIPDPVTVRALATALQHKSFQVIAGLMHFNMLVSPDASLDFETAAALCAHYGVSATKVP